MSGTDEPRETRITLDVEIIDSTATESKSGPKEGLPDLGPPPEKPKKWEDREEFIPYAKYLPDWSS